MNLCINCKFYQSSPRVSTDKCTHDSAKKDRVDNDGVRESFPLEFYSCNSMRAGICRNGQLFKAKQ